MAKVVSINPQDDGKGDPKGKRKPGSSHRRARGQAKRKDPRDAGKPRKIAVEDNDPKSIRNQMRQAALGWRDAGMDPKDFPAVTFVTKAEDDDAKGPLKKGWRGIVQRADRAMIAFNKRVKGPTAILATGALAVVLNVVTPGSDANARDGAGSGEGNRDKVTETVRDGANKVFTQTVERSWGQFAGTISGVATDVLAAFSKGRAPKPDTTPQAGDAVIDRRDDAAVAARESRLNALVDQQGANTAPPPAPAPRPAPVPARSGPGAP